MHNYDRYIGWPKRAMNCIDKRMVPTTVCLMSSRMSYAGWQWLEMNDYVRLSE